MGSINLDKNYAGTTLDKVTVTYEWAAERAAGGRLSGLAGRMGIGKVDLDLAAIAYTSEREPVACANVRGLDPFGDGTLLHTGDTAAKAGENSRESVRLGLGRLHADNGITGVAVVITAKATAEFGKLTLSRVIVEDETSGDVQRKLRGIAGSPTAAILVGFRWSGDGWTMAAPDALFSAAYSASNWRGLAGQAASAVYSRGY